MVAQRISVRTGIYKPHRTIPVMYVYHLFFVAVTLIGGVVFLLFAVTALLHPELSPQGPEADS